MGAYGSLRAPPFGEAIKGCGQLSCPLTQPDTPTGCLGDSKRFLDSLPLATEGCPVEDPKGVRAFQALYPKGPLTRISSGNPPTNEIYFGNTEFIW